LTNDTFWRILLCMDNFDLPLSRLISEDDARDLLYPHQGWVVSLCLNGFELWREFERAMPRHRAGLSNRTRSCFRFSANLGDLS